MWKQDDSSSTLVWEFPIVTWYSNGRDIGSKLCRRWVFCNNLFFREGGKVETVRDFIFSGSKIIAVVDFSHEMKRCFTPWKESYDKPRQRIKKQRHHFANRSLYGQTYGFSSSHVQMGQLDHNEDWALKNWCFWIVVLEKTRESLGLQKDQTSQF